MIKSSQSQLLLTSRIDLYANGSSGNDINSGLSLSEPVKSLSRLADIIDSYCSENISYICCNLSGVFLSDPSNFAYINSISSSLQYIILSGGLNLIQVAGPFTVTTTDRYTLTCAGAAWGVDDYRGYIVKCTSGDGSCLNKAQICTRNSVNQLEVAIKFPTINVTEVTLYRPETTIGSDTGACAIGFDISCPTYIYIQYLSINDTGFSINCHDRVRACITSTTVLKGNSNFLTCFSTDAVLLGNNPLDITVTPPVFDTSINYGIGMVKGQDLNIIDKYGQLAVACSVVGKITRIFSYNQLEHGSRCSQLFHRMCMHFCGPWVNSTETGRVAIENSSGVGFVVEHGSFNVIWSNSADSYLVIRNHASHAIEVRRNGILGISHCSGSSNGGWGLYVHSGSCTAITGVTENVPGALGEISYDGATEAYKWGDFVSSTNEPEQSCLELVSNKLNFGPY